MRERYDPLAHLRRFAEQVFVVAGVFYQQVGRFGQTGANLFGIAHRLRRRQRQVARPKKPKVASKKLDGSGM